MNRAERDEIARNVVRLSQPASRSWLMLRVAALLDPYYATDVPQALIRISAEDWAVELDGYPEWAVMRACRWWKSADNPHRRRKPLEGDISAFAKKEMGVVVVAKRAVSRFNPNLDQPPEKRPVPTAEQRAKGFDIVRAAGFNLKRAGAKDE